MWQPVRGYPVAIAIAVAAKGEEFVSLRTVVEHLSKLVGGEMITEDLLKRILNDDEFNDLVERSRDLVRSKAEPLRQFLRERLPSDDELRLYVAELILPDLELPPGSEKVNVGGEAELHRAVVDGAEVAIRYFLPDANPVRFQREVSALKRLGQQRKPGQPGFLSLPELVKSVGPQMGVWSPSISGSMGSAFVNSSLAANRGACPRISYAQLHIRLQLH